jgi:hypothetical protein
MPFVFVFISFVLFSAFILGFCGCLSKFKSQVFIGIYPYNVFNCFFHPLFFSYLSSSSWVNCKSEENKKESAKLFAVLAKRFLKYSLSKL